MESCSNSKSNSKNELEGMWNLLSMEKRNDQSGDWQNWKEGMQGYLLYNKNNHMALHLTAHYYDSFPTSFNNFSDTISIMALKHLSNNYNYMGKYKIDNGIVRHIKLSHSNPSEWGDTSYRNFYFNNDTLIMSPVEARFSD